MEILKSLPRYQLADAIQDLVNHLQGLGENKDQHYDFFPSVFETPPEEK